MGLFANADLRMQPASPCSDIRHLPHIQISERNREYYTYSMPIT